MTLGQRLRELRAERKLLLRQVAAQAGVSEPYLSQLERGLCAPALGTLQALAAAYGVTLRDLLSAVDFVGQQTSGALPAGLRELTADPAYGPQITPDWTHMLSRIEYQGRRPRAKQDYLELFLFLRRVLP